MWLYKNQEIKKELTDTELVWLIYEVTHTPGRKYLVKNNYTLKESFR
jgi:hypothetical protein